MKKLITVLGLLASTMSFGMNLTCITEIPTTSVVSEIDGEDFVVHVYHHNGFQYMPLHTGIITPNDLPVMAEKAAAFEKLGQHYEFRWALKDCERTDEDIMGCIRGKETEVNGVPVKPWSVYTKRMHTDFDVASYDQVEVGFMFDMEGKTQTFSMQYMKYECSQADKKAQGVLKQIKATK